MDNRNAISRLNMFGQYRAKRAKMKDQIEAAGRTFDLLIFRAPATVYLGLKRNKHCLRRLRETLQHSRIFVAARAHVVKKYEDRERDRQAPQVMADFSDPFFGERPWCLQTEF